MKFRLPVWYLKISPQASQLLRWKKRNVMRTVEREVFLLVPKGETLWTHKLLLLSLRLIRHSVRFVWMGRLPALSYFLSLVLLLISNLINELRLHHFFTDLFASPPLVTRNWCRRSQLVRLIMRRRTRLYSQTLFQHRKRLQLTLIEFFGQIWHLSNKVPGFTALQALLCYLWVSQSTQK